MKAVDRPFLTILLAAGLASCSGGSGSDSADSGGKDFGKASNIGGDADEQARKGLLERFGTSYQEATSQKDKEGNVITQKSRYDNRDAHQGVKTFGSGDRQVSRFDSKEWVGARDRQKETYQGNRSAEGLRKSFAARDRTAGEYGQSARAEGQSFTTRNYGTSAARERSGRSDNVADQRRSNYTTTSNREFADAPVISDKEFRQRTIDETRSILRRDE